LRFTFWMNVARRLREGVTAALELRRRRIVPWRRGRCPSGATASRDRRRRAPGSSSRRLPARCAFISERTDLVHEVRLDLDGEELLRRRETSFDFLPVLSAEVEP